MDTYQYDLVRELSFVRYGGTDAEKAAADILLREIETCGGAGETEEFSIPAYRFGNYAVCVKSPYEKAYDVLPMGLSGAFPAGGADLKLFYAEDCSQAALYGKNDLSDTAVLVNELKQESYQALCERKAAAILVITGRWYDSAENSDFLARNLRPAFLEHGKIPTFFVWAKDAAEMVGKEADVLHIELEQEEMTHTSRNVVATIVGTGTADESAVITAHFDSVNVGTGSWDNATGAATAMYIYRYFRANPPKRTLRFVWCGSEEQGLLGSKAYIEAHPECIKNEVKIGFNFDMCGTTLGLNRVCVTGGEELKHFAEAFVREYGVNAEVDKSVRSSDSAPLADNGIPTVDLMRIGKGAEIHTRHDLMDTLSARQLKKDGDFAIAFIERVVNAARLPVTRTMPDDMKEKLDRYFQRKKQ